MSTGLDVRMLGCFEAVGGSGNVITFPHKKVASLLAFLARQPQRQFTRVELVQEFWPGKDEAQAFNSLSNSLSSLRAQFAKTTLQEEVIFADRSTVSLAPGLVQTDLEQFEGCLKQLEQLEHSPNRSQPEILRQRVGTLERAAELYKGELLPGLEMAWIRADRVRLARMYALILLEAAYDCAKTGEIEDAVWCATQAVKIGTPACCDSRQRDTASIWRQLADITLQALVYLIRLHLRRSDVDTAREHYEHLVTLSHEVGRSVPESTRMLLTSVQNRSFIHVSLLSLERPEARFNQIQIFEDQLQNSEGHLYGRQDDVEALLKFLFGENTPTHLTAEPVRINPGLLTVWGSSGIGKTRLVQQIKRIVQEHYQVPSWFIPLSGVSDGEGLIEAIADALHVPHSVHTLAVTQIAQLLKNVPTLLILDNLNPRLSEVSACLAQLLDHLPNIACVITAPEPLDVPGEREHELGPLPLPNLDGTHEEIELNPCVRLFMQGVRGIRPDFKLDNHDRTPVAELCHRLGGVPLALLLAAARASVFTPAEMLKNLEHDPVIGEAGDKALNRTLYWTYRLLSPQLQDFFLQLSVFQKGWTLAAAKEVCTDSYERSKDQPLAETYLEQLQQWRLVETAVSSTEIFRQRFYLLDEPARFARERFTSTRSDAERQALNERHACYFLGLVEQWRGKRAKAPYGQHKTEYLVRFAEEHDNLTAALAWCLSQNPETDHEGINAVWKGVALAARLWGYWRLRTLYREGLGWLRKAIAAANRYPSISPIDLSNLVEVYNGAGMLSINVGNFDEASIHLLSGKTVAEGLPEESPIELAERVRGRLYTTLAVSYELKARNTRRPSDRSGSFRQAQRYYWMASQSYRRANDEAGQLWSFHGLGKMMWEKGEQAYRGDERQRGRKYLERAHLFFERSLEIARTYRDDQGEAVVLASLASLLWSVPAKRRNSRSRQRYFSPVAQLLLEQCLQLQRSHKDIGSMAATVELFSRFASDQENRVLAAKLRGAARAMCTVAGLTGFPQEQSGLLEWHQATSEDKMGDTEECSQLEQEGYDGFCGYAVGGTDATEKMGYVFDLLHLTVCT